MSLTPGQIVAAVAPIVGKAGAAGIAGNAMQESTDRPNAGGGNLLQWQGARQAGLQAYARSRGLDPSSAEANLGYLIQDLKGPYSGLARQLRQTSDPGHAAVLFSNVYERPGIPMLQNRIKYAQQAAGAPVTGTFPTLKPGRPTTMSIPGTKSTTLDTKAIAEAMFQRLAAQPITDHLSRENGLQDYLNAAQSGKYDVTTSTPSTKITVPGELGANPASRGSGHDINPIHGWALGRTDMGVDARAPHPGAPVLAINDSKVTRIVPNWYGGQPFVELQLTAGPNKGKMWYVAEQITNLPKVGDVIPRGGRVANWAPSGTGIEIGWGGAGGRTLAQATTGYHEGEVTPAGQDFLRRILR